MKRTIVITGAASGIGQATAKALSEAGHRVIGVDLHYVDIVADLATPEGRSAMAESVASLAADGIDSVIACAGVAGGVNPSRLLAVNYFGAVATFELLRPMLLKSQAPRAVAICSTASLADYDEQLVDACLTGDEASAQHILAGMTDQVGTDYCTSKRALSQWLRKAAISEEWAGSGILLNGVSPGFTLTPMTEPMYATEEGREMFAQVTPRALSDCPYGKPEELAEVVAFLATLRSRYVVGQIVYVDGGTEAIVRPGSI